MSARTTPGNGRPSKARHRDNPLRILLAKAAHDRVIARLAEDAGYEASILRHYFNGTRLFPREVALTMATKLGVDTAMVDLLLKLNRR